MIKDNSANEIVAKIAKVDMVIWMVFGIYDGIFVSILWFSGFLGFLSSESFNKG